MIFHSNSLISSSRHSRPFQYLISFELITSFEFQCIRSKSIFIRLKQIHADYRATCAWVIHLLVVVQIYEMDTYMKCTLRVPLRWTDSSLSSSQFSASVPSLLTVQIRLNICGPSRTNLHSLRSTRPYRMTIDIESSSHRIKYWTRSGYIKSQCSTHLRYRALTVRSCWLLILQTSGDEIQPPVLSTLDYQITRIW